MWIRYQALNNLSILLCTPIWCGGSELMGTRKSCLTLRFAVFSYGETVVTFLLSVDWLSVSTVHDKIRDSSSWIYIP